MYVRLGFAVAIHTDPEILLVDEVLAVGDEAFAHRCLRRIEEFLAAGRTLVLVSHALGLVEDLCDRALWLDAGRLIAERSSRARWSTPTARRSPRRKAREHQEAKDARARWRRWSIRTQPARSRGEPLRWGSGAAEITGRAAARRRRRRALPPALGLGGALRDRRARARSRSTTSSSASRITTPRGVECWGTNTDLGGLRPRRFEGEATVVVRCPALRLAPGEYLVDLAVHARDGAPYDYRRRMFAFTVTAQERGVGVYFPEHHWGFEGAIEWGDEET